MAALEGVLSIRFQKPESLWMVGAVGDDPVVGVLPAGISDGDDVILEGDWVDNPRWGRQFKFTSARPALPAGLSGVRRYLERRIKWVGRKTAGKILSEFGEDFFRVLEEEPARLLAVSGITEDRLKEMIQTWNESKAGYAADLFFAEADISPAMQVRIYRTLILGFEYGDSVVDLPLQSRLDAVGRIREDPYCLIEVAGIGFVKADRAARRLGMAEDSPSRVRAGVLHVLRAASDSEGHCRLPWGDVLSGAVKVLGVHPDLVRSETERLTGDGVLVQVEREGIVYFYLQSFYEAEWRVAERLKALAANILPGYSGDASDWLTNRQKDAFKAAFERGLVVVTGLPGTGKTTCLREILDALSGEGLYSALAAPTGKAAKRMSEQTGRSASTIHRLLEYHPEVGFRVNVDDPLTDDVVVIDEMSMTDLFLMDALLDAIDPDTTRLILVGDVNQLPPVGPGRVLNDLIESGICPVIRLTEILRQDDASEIILNAHRIHKGKVPLSGDRDFFIRYVDDQEGIAAEVLRLLRDDPAESGIPLDGYQVLTPVKRYGIGIHELGGRISALLNSGGGRINGANFRVGDRVIQTRNNYDLGVFNGEVGYVRDYDPDEGVAVSFDDGDLIYHPLQARDELLTAWACTVHRSQGSEYPAVIIVLHECCGMLKFRSLLYTAVTRGAKRVWLIGQEEAVHKAVASNREQLRHTGLKGMLV